MAYDFGQKRIGTDNNQERNGGMYTKTILGQSVGDIPVPVWTADKSRHPFVAFQDPKTQKLFGLSRDMLAYGLLALGAPGTGKTNFFNMTLDRMSAQQILRFIRMTAEEMGYGILTDQVMIYAAAVLNVVAAKYPVSLPAIVKLLNEDDDFISEFALQSGLSNVIADNIRANHEAGIVLRRLFERLEEIFEDVYTPGSDTKYNFQSGAKGNLSGMAMYACSCNQSIFNAYLKEEIFHTLKRVPRVRIILDEMQFTDENDELMKYLMQARRQGKIELMMVSQNVREAMHGNAEMDFPNVVLFHHGTPAATDNLSEDLFGSYQYHYPAPVAGDTPHILASFKRAVHWQPQTEERLRVRSQDMYAKSFFFGGTSDYLAVKTILYMPIGEEIIFRRGMKPIFTKRYNIFENELYKRITATYEALVLKKKSQEER